MRRFRSQTTSPSVSGLALGSSPSGLAPVDPGLHGPLAPAPLQDLPRYYGPSRPCAPPRYSAPRGVRRLGSSLSQPEAESHPCDLAAAIGATGSPVPCQRLRRAHATSTPGTARASTQAAPWLRARQHGVPLSRGRVPIPGFDAIVQSFDASAVVHTCSSSRRSPDPVPAGPFPQRSPPRLLTGAACGGLGSPPARRTRRTYLHHWHSTVRAGDLLHRHHSPFRTHGLLT